MIVTRSGLLAVLLMLLAAAGCTAPATTATGAARSEAARATTPAPDDDTAGATADPATGCGDELRALDAVIDEQLAAFAADDWERALSLTSRRFRAGGVDADGLRRIVTSGYATAADAADHEVRGCVRAGDEAQVLIEVTGSDGSSLDLVYLMTREDGRWRIAGAVDHPTGASEPPTVRT